MHLIKLILSPDGKITRLQFLGGLILVFFLTILLYLVPIMVEMYLLTSGQAFYATAEGGQAVVSTMNFYIDPANVSWFSLLTLVPGTLLLLYGKICLDIKRFRDTGNSPWLILLMLVPYVNVLTMLFLFFYPSRK